MTKSSENALIKGNIGKNKCQCILGGRSMKNMSTPEELDELKRRIELLFNLIEKKAL
jgi:hypothetical protein